jgi:hypothetical protein
MFVRNVNIHLPKYTVSYARRLQFEWDLGVFTEVAMKSTADRSGRAVSNAGIMGSNPS